MTTTTTTPWSAAEAAKNRSSLFFQRLSFGYHVRRSLICPRCCCCCCWFSSAVARQWNRIGLVSGDVPGPFVTVVPETSWRVTRDGNGNHCYHRHCHLLKPIYCVNFSNYLLHRRTNSRVPLDRASFRLYLNVVIAVTVVSASSTSRTLWLCILAEVLP